MDKIIQALVKIKNPIAKIVFIVLALGAIGVGLFFTSGCAYKFHADKIDNVSREFYLTPKR